MLKSQLQSYQAIVYNLSGDLYWAGSVIGGATTGQWTTDGTNVWRAGGNVGIGTTSPGTALGVQGDIVGAGKLTVSSLAATSTTATSTFSTGGLTVGTNQFVVQQNSGNVGVGTTSPAQLLSIAGHCVTGDTRLRRRRKKKNATGESEDDYDYDEVPIKDIQAGDEIASLDEATGTIVWSKVNALMDMGVKQTYRLTTASGRQIRTTAEHPYLTSEGWKKVSELAAGMAVAVPRRRAKTTYAFIDGANVGRGAEASGWKIDYAKLARYLATRFGADRVFYFSGTSDKPERIKLYEQLRQLGFEVLLTPTRRFSDGTTKADVDSRMTFEMMRMKDEYDRAVALTGDGDFYWVLEYLRKQKDRVALLSFGKRTARSLTRLFGPNATAFETIRQRVENKGIESADAHKTPKVVDAFDESTTRVFPLYTEADMAF